jgi:PAS domain S-box-containing protein
VATAFEAGSGRRRLAVLAEWAGEAVITLDRDGRIERWNAGAERLYGHPERDVAGRPLREVLGADLPPPAPDGSLRDFTGAHLHRDGRTLEIAGTVWPVLDQDGTVTGALVVARSRTEVEKVARRLRDEANHLWEAQEMAQLGTWAWHPGAKEVIWNDALHRIFGTDPETYEPSVEGYLERVHPDDRERVLDEYTRTLTTGEPFDHLERIVRAGGEVRHVHARGRLVSDPDGSLRMIGVILDVTERVRGQEQLREAVERLEEAQEIGRLGSWEWHIRDDRVIWSDVLYDVYGVDRETFAASYEAYLALVHPADRTTVERTVRRALETCEPFEFTHRLIRPDGSVRTLHCRGRVETGADGRPVRMVGTAHDVTEQREAERRLATAAAQLELTRRMAHLLSITEAALEHLELDDLLPELIERISAAVELDLATVHLVDEPGVLRLRAARGDVRAERLAVGEGFAGLVVERRETLRLDDPDELAAVAPGERAAGLAVLAGVPLVVDEEVVGALCAGSRSPDGLPDEAVTLLRLAAQRTAIAIQHGRLYERERRIAETLQRSLLPAALPAGGPVEVAARYLPATAEIGGDWYDAIPLDGGALGLVLGDVSGHGIRAAALMAELRHALGAYAHDGRAPAEIAERLDGLMRRRGHENIATLVYGELAPGGTLRVVSAGHLPPLVAGAGGARLLELPAGPPLGCGGTWEHVELRLAPGATLVFYSDGLVERREEVLDTGLERLRAAAAKGPLEPDALCAHLVTALVPGGGSEDDVAVVAARPLPTRDASAGAPAPPRAASRGGPR